jgi:hypothetical protein
MFKYDKYIKSYVLRKVRHCGMAQSLRYPCRFWKSAMFLEKQHFWETRKFLAICKVLEKHEVFRKAQVVEKAGGFKKLDVLKSAHF